jgi:xanthine dehydrogenase accessory factor
VTRSGTCAGRIELQFHTENRTGIRTLTDERETLIQAESWRRSGRGVAIATVVETFGSAPRPLGAHLVVDETGRFIGSVSAGCVEGDVIAAAIDIIADGAPRLLEFGVANEIAWRAGLSCGGRIAVFVERLDDAGLERLAASNRLSEARHAHAIVTPLDGGAARLTAGNDVVAQYGGQSRMVTDDVGRRSFIEYRLPASRLVIVGAVHVAQVLARMASLAAFDVRVVDPRHAYATRERFPEARLDPRWPDEALPDIGLDFATAVVVLAHDPKIEDPALRAALKSNCFYIGALGSHATATRRVERLLAAGVSRKALARLHAPIGLDIGALSPADIAVSTLAEIILERQRKSLRGAAREHAA